MNETKGNRVKALRLFFLPLLFTICGLAGCAEPTSEEAARVTSPDKIVDAVLMKRNVGATVGTPFEVYIVPIGQRPAGEPLIRGDKFEALELH